MSLDHLEMPQLVSELLQEVRSTGVPLASDSRKAVLRGKQAQLPATRSCLFGLYTKIGTGVATQTWKPKWQRLLRLIHALAKKRSPLECHPYAAIMLNHNTSVGVHADRFNTGKSSLLSWGDHRGGQLWIECSEGQHREQLLGRSVSTPGCWQSFDAHARHCVLPALPSHERDEPERFSVSLFCPGRLAEVTPEIWHQLRSAGFPVDELILEAPDPCMASTSSSRSSHLQRGRRGQRRSLSRSLMSGVLAGSALPQSAEGSMSRSGMSGVLAGSVSSAAGSPQVFSAPLAPELLRGSHQPGTACMCSIETLWQQLQRKRMPSRFLEFLRKGRSFAFGGEEMPSQDREAGTRARWHKGRQRRQWVNASIAYIDWLYLGKPAGDGLKWAAALRSPLSKQQQFLVGELERTYLAVCRPGEVTPVDPPGGGLSLLAKVLHLSSGLGYGAQAVKKQSVLPVQLNESNMSLPEIAGVVPLKAPVMPSAFERILETPEIFLRRVEDMPERLPPWFMCVHHWPRIAQQLLDRGLCRPVLPDELTTWKGQHLRAGLFGVAKPQTEQRRVIDGVVMQWSDACDRWWSKWLYVNDGNRTNWSMLGAYSRSLTARSLQICFALHSPRCTAGARTLEITSTCCAIS
eukprot:193500-Amphidinium_carterae.3